MAVQEHKAEASASAQPSSSSTRAPAAVDKKASSAQPAKLLKNARLPATMITAAGSIQASQKNKANKGQVSKKKKARTEKGKDRAVELSSRLEEKVRGREDRKAKRQRAKKAWE
ncbi:hypothetical protein L202_02078 [Cryptococcus amylolentus CBS 6039]|uniref:Uncharacterized protein n=2 Tax=Cryptococcus amylolentus TaxID=104669 RepID=A0A1E3I1I0_9TREE|nr:hypothetical protein L202_02078 [Cryptococcus amylolentus CBS 6039]ODN81681.1 hypothetical protein L202_02078 [Cryptococcus amylolentus CBS 6039]ODO10113.1 hypothetical protein I350_02341 [Cryptococcus amylolentus CBS 6273]